MPTLLEGLIKANGVQGGTIHQYFAHRADWHPMQDAYRLLLEAGVMITTQAMFNRLAARYGLTITWG